MDKAAASWLERNQRLSKMLREQRDEVLRLRRVIAVCPRCSRFRGRPGPNRPDWAQGPQWEGWNWKPKDASLVRFTLAACLEVTADGDLVQDAFTDDHPELLSCGDPDRARAIAGILAAAQGGWTEPGMSEEEFEARLEAWEKGDSGG